jgi:CRP-like cAMP-binding protein
MTKHADSLQETQAKELLRNMLITTVGVESAQLDPLLDLFELVSYKKNHAVIEEGIIADYFYFIFKGVIRVYYYKNDKMVIERFEKEGGLFGGNFTHLTKKPGTHIYESVEEVVLLRIKYSNLEELCKREHAIERVYRIMMEAFHSGYVERLFSFKSLSSEERYHEFILQYGEIANRVPLKDIANYLGMTPETLSRIRSKYDKSHQTKK